MCTLPSPACMCSATQTRPLQHLACGCAGIRRRSARSAAPAKMRSQRRAGSASSTTRAACGPAAARRSVRAAVGCTRSSRASQRCHSARTSRSSASACCTRSSSSSARGDLAGVVALAQRQRCRCAKKASSASTSASLLRRLQLDVDALDAVGVLAHARQRDHHVLVDLEGVGVLADRRGALAVEPELLARLGADGDEALAARAQLAMRTTSLVARATASASSPTMSPNSTIFGSSAAARLLLVA